MDDQLAPVASEFDCLNGKIITIINKEKIKTDKKLGPNSTL